MRRAAPLVVLAFGCATAPAPAPAPASSFNQRVLSVVAEYPARGHGGYAWPSAPGASGTTRDLVIGDAVIARAGPGNHCVGMTLEVFWRALDGCAGGVGGVLDAQTAAALKTEWYVPALGGRGAAAALPAHHLGAPVALDAARPGDFVQAWSSTGLGHSMVFLGWTRDAAGTIVAIRYWSSQPWTEGIGISESPVGAAGSDAALDGFDRDQIYVARASCPS